MEIQAKDNSRINKIVGYFVKKTTIIQQSITLLYQVIHEAHHHDFNSK